MPGNVTFDTDSTQVKLFRSVLDSVSEVLKEYDSTMLQIAGHTDSTGGDRYNLLLSQQRPRRWPMSSAALACRPCAWT